MNIKEFFDMSEEQRQFIIDLHNKQKNIRDIRDAINDERQKLNTRELNNQLDCIHQFAKSKYVAHENEFGNLTGGGTTYYHCEDCGYHWSEDK
jgi:rubrerythrin